MIFVAFLVPLAVYLLLLSAINRRPRPVLVSGTWDFVGLLFASSGFLIVGGPAILTSSALWLVLAAAYFVAVLVGCVKLWTRYRQLTSIYNVEPEVVEGLLAEICDQLGLGPIRSGNLLVFGLPAEVPCPRGALRPDAIQGPHAPQLVRPAPAPARPAPAEPPAEMLPGQSTILELEMFAAMKHVTLRWGPHDSPVRHAVEAELEHRLAHVEAPAHDTSVWMNLTAWGLLCLSLATLVLLAIRTIMMR